MLILRDWPRDPCSGLSDQLGVCRAGGQARCNDIIEMVNRWLGSPPNASYIASPSLKI
jgi:hypothetical protein